MADEVRITATVGMRGDATVSLDTMAIAFFRLSELIDALRKEVGGNLPLVWGVHDLRPGSAYIEIRPEPTDLGAEDRGRRISMGLDTAAVAAEQGDYASIPWPLSRRATLQLASALPETAFLQLNATGTPITITHVPVHRILDQGVSWGTVTGRVETLSTHNGPHFTLFEDVFGTGVSCFLHDSTIQVNLFDIMERRVEVEGIITADPITGIPKSIRQIAQVDILDTSEADSTRTKGIWSDWGTTPEERLAALRRVRSGEQD